VNTIARPYTNGGIIHVSCVATPRGIRAFHLAAAPNDQKRRVTPKTRWSVTSVIVAYDQSAEKAISQSRADPGEHQKPVRLFELSMCALPRSLFLRPSAQNKSRKE